MNNPTSGTVIVPRELLEELRNLCGDPDTAELATSILAQTAEQQEPVAWVNPSNLSRYKGDIGATVYQCSDSQAPLYRHPAPQQRTEEQERAEFEREHVRYCESTGQRPRTAYHMLSFVYFHADVQMAWEAWQARAALDIRAAELPPPPYSPELRPEDMTPYEQGEAQGRCDMWAEVARLNGIKP